jgi:Zn ribbon nucleic-acid-binding protein
MKCHACRQDLALVGFDEDNTVHLECVTPECTQYKIELY